VPAGSFAVSDNHVVVMVEAPPMPSLDSALDPSRELLTLSLPMLGSTAMSGAEESTDDDVPAPVSVPMCEHPARVRASSAAAPAVRKRVFRVIRQRYGQKWADIRQIACE
jgi:hypothetical protein